jgi:hypothetical protein
MVIAAGISHSYGLDTRESCDIIRIADYLICNFAGRAVIVF